jgi:Tfp pilus assembly protein PilN
MMNLFPSRRQWKAYALPTKLSLIGSFVSVLSLILATGTLFYQPSSSIDIKSKIQELDKIQVALTTLNSYVDNQQKTLKNISEQKSSLEKEQTRIQSALKIDKDKLDALLEYQLSQQQKSIWIELLISFSVGVLSSSIVTFFAVKYQGKNSKQQKTDNK